MQTPSIKRLAVNILVVVVVAGIFFAAYMFFVKEKNVPTDSTLENNENQAILIGTEISQTLKELRDLQLAITASKNIFGMSIFKSLHDFSVVVPEEEVKRENPFLPPQWKVELDKRMDTVNK